MNKDGTGYAILVNFGSDASDGVAPYAGLVEGSDGALYGTALLGGSQNGGTVFTLNKDGTGYAVLKNFREFGGDGLQPNGSVFEGSDGALYGTTYWGGLYGVERTMRGCPESKTRSVDRYHTVASHSGSLSSRVGAHRAMSLS